MELADLLWKTPLMKDHLKMTNLMEMELLLILN
jgi:hypothetical protein